MAYAIEDLGPEKFQQFAQALLCQEYPGTQCFPVGQPDGGRDGTAPIPDETENFIVFQVKYSRNPLGVDNPRQWLLDTIQSEIPKVKELIPRGASKYLLITNVPGTAHLDNGSIDRLEDILKPILKIPAKCWWRDDICRRLDSAWDLKWSYPELLSSADLLRVLVTERLTTTEERRQSAAVHAFLTAQYHQDSSLRFKQIELNNQLSRMFVDVPINGRPVKKQAITDDDATSLSATGELYLDAEVLTRIQSEIMAISQTGSRRIPTSLVQSSNSSAFSVLLPDLGAAAVLLHPSFQEIHPVSVLEGGPGQGKSTITQFVCQVHRIRLIGYKDYNERHLNGYYRRCPLRLPIRIDLRDLATWLNGKHPFIKNDSATNSLSVPRTLETFIAVLITSQSGGHEFSVADLVSISQTLSLLLVFDGLDEIADTDLRNSVINEVLNGVRRISSFSLAQQVVITTRPSAFARGSNSTVSELPTIVLRSLQDNHIWQFARQWVSARTLKTQDIAALEKTLRERSRKPHFRDLCQNLMQLSILLALLRKRGESVPDQRTALYEDYMNLFMDREAEKTSYVNQYRDLLINVHGYIGFYLHAAVERNKNSGKISEKDLVKLVHRYLTSDGFDPALTEVIVSGIQRVMLLVARDVDQEQYEFVIQPLREFFAARHLNHTAPSSLPGREMQGSKPDRFEAVAPNMFWLNVSRFFAGFFHKGEHAGLLASLEDLESRHEFSQLYFPRLLIAMFLVDWIFSQSPKVTKQAIKRITKLTTLRLFYPGSASLEMPLLKLADECGRRELAFELLLQVHASLRPDDIEGLIKLLRLNTTPAEVSEMVNNRLNSGSMDVAESRCWLDILIQIGSIDAADGIVDRIRVLGATERAELLLTAGNIPHLSSDAEASAIAINQILDLEITPGPVTLVRSPSWASALGVFLSIFNPGSYLERMSLISINRLLLHPFAEQPILDEATSGLPKVVYEIAELVRTRGLDNRAEAHFGFVELAEIAKMAQNHFGERVGIAAFVTVLLQYRRPYAQETRLFNPEADGLLGYIETLSALNGAEQWQTELSNAVAASPVQKFAVVFSAIKFAPTSMFFRIASQLTILLESLDDQSWRALTVTIHLYDSRYDNRLRRLKFPELKPVPATTSYRAMLVLSQRYLPHADMSEWVSLLKQCTGDDSLINWLAIHAFVSASSQGHNLSDFDSNIRACYSRLTGRQPNSLRNFRVPDTAVFGRGYEEVICSNAISYPVFIHQAAEVRLGARASAKTPSVADVAIKDIWFDPDLFGPELFRT